MSDTARFTICTGKTALKEVTQIDGQ